AAASATVWRSARAGPAPVAAAGCQPGSALGPGVRLAQRDQERRPAPWAVVATAAPAPRPARHPVGQAYLAGGPPAVHYARRDVGSGARLSDCARSRRVQRSPTLGPDVAGAASSRSGTAL